MIAGFQWAGSRIYAQETASGEAPDNLVIYLLIGQSNMVGRAPIPSDMRGSLERCWHFDTRSHLLLGERYAEAMLHLENERARLPAPKPPLDLKPIDVHLHGHAVDPKCLERVPVKPMTTLFIKPGCRYCAVGNRRVVNIPIPAFDPDDEWIDEAVSN